MSTTILSVCSLNSASCGALQDLSHCSTGRNKAGCSRRRMWFHAELSQIILMQACHTVCSAEHVCLQEMFTHFQVKRLTLKLTFLFLKEKVVMERKKKTKTHPNILTKRTTNEEFWVRAPTPPQGRRVAEVDLPGSSSELAVDLQHKPHSSPAMRNMGHCQVRKGQSSRPTCFSRNVINKWAGKGRPGLSQLPSPSSLSQYPRCSCCTPVPLCPCPTQPPGPSPVTSSLLLPLALSTACPSCDVLGAAAAAEPPVVKKGRHIPALATGEAPAGALQVVAAPAAVAIWCCLLAEERPLRWAGRCDWLPCSGGLQEEVMANQGRPYMLCVCDFLLWRRLSAPCWFGSLLGPGGLFGQYPVFLIA